MKGKAAKIIVIATVTTLAAGSLWAIQNPGAEKPIVLSGTIEGRDVEIGSLVGGRVAQVHVKEGDLVNAGDPVITLETNLINPQIEEQNGRLSEAQARLELLVRGSRKEDIDKARYEWENAERERGRFEILVKAGAISQHEYDFVATKASTLRETLRALENGSRAEDIAAARAAVAREAGHLAFLMKQRDESIVYAPSAGIVQTIDLEPGDMASASAPVARLLDPSDQWVRVYVPEPKLGSVRVGQTATITVDTWKNKTFTGTVTEIRTRGEYTPRNVQTLSQRADQVFAVKVTLNPSSELKPGMAAQVSMAANNTDLADGGSR